MVDVTGYMQATLVIEAFMSNPPQPTNFGVMLEGKIVALLSYEQVKEGLEKWDAMRGGQQKSASREG